MTPGIGIGGRPAYNITLYATTKGITKPITRLGGGEVTLAIPYTPGGKEAVGGLVATFVDEAGKNHPVIRSIYDGVRGCMLLSSSHFSTFGIDYALPATVTAGSTEHPAKQAIDFVLARGLMGAKHGAFTPDISLTRVELAAALHRLAATGTALAGAGDLAGITNASALLWATNLGIMPSVAEELAPQNAVTREELAAVIERFAKAAGISLPIVRSTTEFEDANAISGQYRKAVATMQRAGIAMGIDGNRFDPTSPATRAQGAAWLARLVGQWVDPATAQGWEQNDDWQHLFYENGAPFTGRHEIGGAEYFFYTTGVLHNGWMTDAVGNRTFIFGNKPLTGWWDIGSTSEVVRYHFDENGRLLEE